MTSRLMHTPNSDRLVWSVAAGGYEYLLFGAQLLPHSVATDACRAVGATLAVMPNADVNAAVYKLIMDFLKHNDIKDTNAGAWLGLTIAGNISSSLNGSAGPYTIIAANTQAFNASFLPWGTNGSFPRLYSNVVKSCIQTGIKKWRTGHLEAEHWADATCSTDNYPLCMKQLPQGCTELPAVSRPPTSKNSTPSSDCPDLEAMIAIRRQSKMEDGIGWKADGSCYCHGNRTLWGQADGTYACTAEGRIRSIKLHWSLLWESTALPPAIGQLEMLEELDLAHNSFTGSLPADWSTLTNLRRLDLTDNKLSGTFPEQWSTMTGLQHLSLGQYSPQARYDFSHLPQSFSSLSSLSHLSLQWANITGVPRVLLSMPAVTHLELIGNNMTINGSLPLEFTSMTWLKSLKLVSNEVELGGTIPEQYSTLTGLQTLVVDNLNQGSIPRWFGSMKQLKGLTINNASIAGTIPDWLTEMTSMQELALEMNRLEGKLPLWLTTMNLTWIRFARNPHLSGPLPEEFSTMTQLTKIGLNGNNHSGPIPDSWSTLTNLDSLWLSSNPLLHGTLPRPWSRLIGLELFWLQNTKVGGDLPQEWSTMVKIRELMLYNASVTGTLPASYANWDSPVDSILLQNNSLHGPLPASWSKFKTLRQLGLADNNFEGPLPEEWGTMSGMAIMLLQNNRKLNGSIPLSWAFNMPSLQFIQLNNNSLTGDLPTSWSTLQSVVTLDLSSNNFSGSLPCQWSTMGQLKKLSLNDNSIHGTLPPTWSAMTTASLLSLQHNDLSGMLPASWSNMAGLKKLDLSLNNLTGPVPEAWAHMSSLQLLDVSLNNLQGSIPASWSTLDDLTYLGIHGNPYLCRGNNSCYSMMTKGGWSKLRYVSTQGGINIPPDWCNSPDLPGNRSLLFVGDPPTFDKCMEKICVAQRPEDYRFRYVQKFDLNNVLANLAASSQDAVIAQFISSTLDVRVVDGEIADSVFQALGGGDTVRPLDVDRLIRLSGGEGWNLGDGGRYDPCVHRQAIRNTAIAYCIFGVLLLAIAIDWIVQANGGAGIVKGAVSLWQKVWPPKGTEELPLQTAAAVSYEPPVTARVSYLRTISVAATRVVKKVTITIAMYMVPYVSMAIDVLSDLYLVVQLHPHRTSYMLLAALMAADVISASIIYKRCVQHHKTVSDAGSRSEDSAAELTLRKTSSVTPSTVKVNPPLFEKLFRLVGASTGGRGAAIRIAMAALLVPAMSITIHAVGAALAAHVLLSVFTGEHVTTWHLLGLDLRKCVVLRSFVVGFLESPCAIAFTSWAYLAPHKRDVGQYISTLSFFVNLALSMVHVLIESWGLKELLLRNGNSLSASWADVSHLEADENLARAGSTESCGKSGGVVATAAQGQRVSADATSVMVVS